jgi:transcriptional regulator with XRE-family HTH domain
MNAEHTEDAQGVAEKIRRIREGRDLTVERLAEYSGVDAGMIEKLEEGLLAPSLAPLLKISRAMGIRLGTLLDDAPQAGPIVVTGGRSEKVIRFSGYREPSADSSLDFFSLAADKKDRHMEPFVITVRPGERGDLKLSDHEGEEFIYVLDGVIKVHYGKDVYRLEAGDSIYYDSVVPHYVRTAGADEARLLAVVYAPL